MQPFRADRLSQLPPYLFAEIVRKKAQAIRAGRDIIDFGVGDPDQPTPRFIIDRMADAIRDPANHTYSIGIGMAEFRNAVTAFFHRRYGVRLDPESQVLTLLGSKEGIGHLPTAVVNAGEVVLVPEPAYPVYVAGTLFAGGVCYTMPLRETNGWLPVWHEIPPDILDAAKLMYLNYPNNPTGACATRSFFEEAVAFAREHGILIAQDAAYNELFFGEPPLSILQIEGADEVAIEFHSLSKTFNMTGWRIAFAVGSAEILAALSAVKNNLDSGVFQAVQQAGVAALEGANRPEIHALTETYRNRRDILAGGLRESGWTVEVPDATFYLWSQCPAGRDSFHVVSRMLDEVDVVAVPGTGFGRCGEGYIRFALTVDETATREAVERISRLRW